MLVTTTYPLRTFDRRFDRAFSNLAGWAFGPATRPQAVPAVSGDWADGNYVLTVDLPGVPEDALSVNVAGRTLTIDVATDELTWNERLRLPQTLDPEQVTARYADGRLTVTVPQRPEATPRRIAIDTSPAQAAIETGESEPQEAASATSVTE